jgi:cation diffusion facilitator family transporter
LSGAVSIVADALNNLTDAASSVVTLLGFRLAQRPADPDHPYGHARYEYLSGLTVAALILVIGVELADSSVRKIMNPTGVDISVVTFIVLGCSVAIKLWMSVFFASLGKKISSSALKAASVDSRNDVIATAAVLVGCVVSGLFDIPADGYIGLGVALFILYSGVGVAKETISPLLGQRADPELVERISKHVLSYEKVLGVHDLLVHDYGPGQCFASVHVELSAREDPLVCHDVIDAIECDVLENLNVHLVIHYDPVLDNDCEWEQMRKIVESIIAEIDPGLSLHDFRITRGAENPKLVFDLAVPYAMGQERKLLKEQIDKALADRSIEYTTVIRFDDKV